MFVDLKTQPSADVPSPQVDVQFNLVSICQNPSEQIIGTEWARPEIGPNDLTDAEAVQGRRDGLSTDGAGARRPWAERETSAQVTSRSNINMKL